MIIDALEDFEDDEEVVAEPNEEEEAGDSKLKFEQAQAAEMGNLKEVSTPMQYSISKACN